MDMKSRHHRKGDESMEPKTNPYWTPEKLWDLAKRIDEAIETFDPYGHGDAEGTPEMALELLNDDPLSMVEELLEMVEVYQN